MIRLTKGPPHALLDKRRAEKTTSPHQLPVSGARLSAAHGRGWLSRGDAGDEVFHQKEASLESLFKAPSPSPPWRGERGRRGTPATPPLACSRPKWRTA
mmetsp:Transcript_18051/g.46829  ORF Transcript_18051/g.46829 Transcript_18051/m.46829 type:complete len:99 (+) Transcript_18051:214-510(+)